MKVKRKVLRKGIEKVRVMVEKEEIDVEKGNK